MEAIILAAGRGRRMQKSDLPKCLLRVGGRALLDYQLQNLVQLSITQVTLCIGYEGDLIRRFVEEAGYPLNIHWVINPDYLTTNNSYSLALTLKDRPASDFMVINGDNLLDPRIFELLANGTGSLLPYIVKPTYDPEDMKVCFGHSSQGSWLTRIGKDIRPSDAQGESLGIRRFAPPFSLIFQDQLHRLINQPEGKNQFFTAAIQSAINAGGRLAMADVTHLCYADVDFDHDIKEAQTVAEKMTAV